MSAHWRLLRRVMLFGSIIQPLRAKRVRRSACRELRGWVAKANSLRDALLLDRKRTD
jgi:hypothetical protein